MLRRIICSLKVRKNAIMKKRMLSLDITSMQQFSCDVVNKFR